MQRKERLVALAIMLTAAACERGGLPTATLESRDPLFAGGPTGRYKSFRLPTDNSRPRHITLGSDGAMWFTESNFDVSQIGRIDADGNITEFVVPPFSQPSDIVSGPDGALWFTGPSGAPDYLIGRMTTDGQFTGFAPRCGDFACSVGPAGIASGPDGNIWFTDHITNAIWRLTPGGVFTSYTIPTPGASPSGITAGPDRALWFAEFHANQIGRIDPATGTITEFSTFVGPNRITTGPDGNLWFTSPFENKIGKMTTGGVTTEFPLTAPSQPRDIVAGPDGNLWFTEYLGERLSQITPEGVVTEVKRVRGGPWGIGRGAGTDIWLTQFDGNRVARFTLGQ